MNTQYIDGMVKGIVPMYQRLKRDQPDKYNSTIKKFQEEARIDKESVLNEGLFKPGYGGYPKYFFIEILKALGEPLEPQ